MSFLKLVFSRFSNKSFPAFFLKVPTPRPEPWGVEKEINIRLCLIMFTQNMKQFDWKICRTIGSSKYSSMYKKIISLFKHPVTFGSRRSSE